MCDVLKDAYFRSYTVAHHLSFQRCVWSTIASHVMMKALLFHTLSL